MQRDQVMKSREFWKSIKAKITVKQGTGSVLKRLLYIYLLMMAVIYIMIAGIFINYTMRMNDGYKKEYENQVDKYLTTVEQQFVLTRSIQLNMVENNSLNKLGNRLYKDAYDKAQMIEAVDEDLKNALAFNTLLEDIVITLPGEGIQLSAVDGYEKGGFNWEDIERWSTAASFFVSNGDQIEMNIAYPLTLSIEEGYVPLYVIRNILSEDKVRDSLDGLRSGSFEKGAFFVHAEGDTAKIWAESYDVDQEVLDALLHKTRENNTIKSSQDKEEQENSGSLTASEEGQPAVSAAGKAEIGEWPGETSLNISLRGRKYWVNVEEISGYQFYLVTYMDTRELSTGVLASLFFAGIMLVLVSVLFTILILFTNRSIGRPLRKIMEACQQMRQGNLEVRIFHEPQDEFQYIYTSFNEMAADIKQLIADIREQRTLLENAELAQLQSQINPHFLYNSFYLIKCMANNEDYDQIIEMVTSLAKYYRFINKELEQNIPLEREVAHMINYLDIQQMRFGDKITVEREELPKELREVKVPKLILQPIVENAYNYGLKNKLSDGIMRIRYEAEGRDLRLIIEDNGSEMSEEKLIQLREQIQEHDGAAIGHAMTNIQRRLSLAYGQGGFVELSIGELGGLKVTLHVDTEVAL